LLHETLRPNASNMASTFSVGVLHWMLCIVAKTNPFFWLNIRWRSVTCRRTWSGVPKGRIFCVSTPPPQKTILPPYLSTSPCGSIPTAEDGIEHVETRLDETFDKQLAAAAAVLH